MTDNNNGYSKIKHLEFITGSIERMARNSFMIKAWMIAVFAAIISMKHTQYTSIIYFGAGGVVAIFWWMDSFYLRLERKYRLLFEDVRKNDYSNDPYIMDTEKYNDYEQVRSMQKIMLSGSEWPYLVCIGAVFFALLVENRCIICKLICGCR